MKQQIKIKKTGIGEIPEDWDVRRLGEIGEITGAGVDKKIRHDEIPVRLLNYLDVYHKDFIYSEELNHWVTAPITQAKRCAVKKGDIFFTPSSEMRTEIGISAVAMEDMPNVVYSYHVDRLRLFENWDLKFRAYAFKTKHFIDQCETVCEGSGKRYVISLSKFRSLTIKYPKDPKEQSAIAQVLSDTDTLIESLNKLIEKKKNIKQGTMQQLLTGKKRLKGFIGDWEEKRLGEIADFEHGHGLSKSDLDNDGKNKCIHYGQLFTEYKELIKNIRCRTHQNQNNTYSKKNDVLMPTSDVTPRGLATASCIKEAGVVLGGGILIIRLHSNYEGLFLSNYITHNKDQILRLVKGSTVFHIYASDLKNLEIMLPKDPKEQSAISQVLSDMDAEIVELERKRDKYMFIKKGMMQELLTGRIRLKY